MLRRSSVCWGPCWFLFGFAFSSSLAGKVCRFLPFGLVPGAVFVLPERREGPQDAPHLLNRVLVLFLDVHGGDTKQSGQRIGHSCAAVVRRLHTEQ